MERMEPKFPQPEDADKEHSKAAEALNLPESMSPDEVRDAYFRFELAQMGRKPDEEAVKKARENWEAVWNNPATRAAKIAELGWVGEKIRESTKEPIPELALAEESNDKYDANKEKNFKNLSELSDDALDKISAAIDKSLGVVVHGEKNKNRKSEFYDEAYMRPDFDARMAAYLLQNMAVGKTEWNVSRAVNKGAHIKGAINLDTGERPGGITINEKDGTIFIDHHGEKEEDPTSASKITYELLDKLGKLELKTKDGKEVPKEVIKKIIDFSVENDNLDYPIDEKFYKETWWQTLYAGKVYEKMPIDKVIEFFQEGNDPRSPLPEKYREIEVRVLGARRDETGNRMFETKTIGELLGQERADVEKAIEGIRENEREMAELKEKGEKFGGRAYDNNTPELGKFLFNRMPTVGSAKYPRFEMRIPPTHTMVAARALGGYNTVIGWNELNKSIRVESDKDIYPLFKRLKGILPGIKSIRGRMIIDNLTGDYKDTQKRDAKMTDILNAVFSYADNPAEDEKNKQKEEKERKEREDAEAKKKAETILADKTKLAQKLKINDLESVDLKDFSVSQKWIDNLASDIEKGEIRLKLADNNDEDKWKEVTLKKYGFILKMEKAGGQSLASYQTFKIKGKK